MPRTKAGAAWAVPGVMRGSDTDRGAGREPGLGGREGGDTATGHGAGRGTGEAAGGVGNEFFGQRPPGVYDFEHGRYAKCVLRE